MGIIRDIAIGSFGRDVDREVKLRLNLMSNSICVAYLLAMRARNVDTGEVRKLLVSLHAAEPLRALEDAVDVYVCNRRFDFAAFGESSYERQSSLILETLHSGLLEICNALHLNRDDLDAAHEEVKACEFVFEYRKGKPIINKKAALSAQLGVVSTPAWTSVVAYVQDADPGHEARTVTFVKSERPDLRFESRYLGKLKWVSPFKLALTPKDSSVAVIEVDLSAVR